MSEERAYNPSDGMMSLISGGTTPNLVQYNQRNRSAEAVVEHPSARVNGGSPMTTSQHTRTPAVRQGQRGVRLTPNQIEVHCDQCDQPLYYFPSQLKAGLRHFCNRLCLGKWRSAQHDAGAAHWKGGEKDDDGRVYWHLPWHPRADKKGYVPRAFIVAELKYGRAVLSGEIVHHKDEDHGNDHPDNLEILGNQSEHARLHGLNRTREQLAAMRAAKQGAA